MELIKLIPLMGSVALLEDNIEFLDKKKKTSKDFIGQGVKNIFGTAMIRETAKLTDF